MASGNEKFVRDAKRAKTRSILGYLRDRALGEEDFEKEPTVNPAPAAEVPRGPRVIGGANPANKETLEAAGMKKGGKVKCYAKGGSIDGAATRGKTRGTFR